MAKKKPAPPRPPRRGDWFKQMVVRKTGDDDMNRSGLIRRTFPITVVRDEAEKNPEIVISSESVDRQGDVVVASGGDWSGWWKTGAPVLWAHRHDELPVAKGIRLWVDAHARTRSAFRWVEGDDFAQRVKNVFEQDLLAASIGFIPIEYEPLGKGAGTRYRRWAGLEYSFTPIPANTDAIPVMRALGLLPDEVALDLDDEGASNRGDIAIDVSGFTDDELVRLATHTAQRRRHATEPLPPVCEMGPDQVRQVIAEVLPGVLRSAVTSEVRSVLRRLTGKVD